MDWPFALWVAHAAQVNGGAECCHLLLLWYNTVIFKKNYYAEYDQGKNCRPYG